MANRIPITDFSDPMLDIYARTPEVQLLRYREPKPGVFIAESPKVIARALDAGYEPISFLMEPQHVETQGKELLARCPDTPVYVAELAVLNELTGFSLTRGMLCAMNRKPLPSVEQVCKDANRIAVLENVVNPTNVGAIVVPLRHLAWMQFSLPPVAATLCIAGQFVSAWEQFFRFRGRFWMQKAGRGRAWKS